MILDRISANFKEVALGSVLAISTKVIAIGCIFLMNLVIVRQIGAHEAGVFFLCLATVSFVANIGRLGLDKSLVRFISAAKSANNTIKLHGVFRKAITWGASSCLIFASLLFAFREPISVNIFNKSFLEPVLTIMIIAIPLIGLYTLHASSLQGLKKILMSMISLSLIVPLCTLLLLSIFGSNDALDVALIYLVSCAVALVAANFFWRISTSKKTYQVKFSSAALRQSCIPLWGAVFCNQIVAWSSLIFLGVWGSAEDVGIFAIAQRTALLTSLVLIGVNAIVAPKLSELISQSRHNEVIKIAHLAVRLSLVAALPSFIAITIYPNELLNMFGSEFTMASTALIVLAFGQLINNITGPIEAMLTMSGNESKVGRNFAVGAFLSLLLGILLIPDYGIIGAAVTQAVAVASQNLMGVFQVKRLFGFNVMLFWRPK